MIEPVFSLLFGINSWLLKLRRTPHAADRFSYGRCANALILKAHVGTTHKSHGFRSFGIRSRRALNRRYSLIYWLFVYLCVKSRKRTVYDKISHLIRERYTCGKSYHFGIGIEIEEKRFQWRDALHIYSELNRLHSYRTSFSIWNSNHYNLHRVRLVFGLSISISSFECILMYIPNVCVYSWALLSFTLLCSALNA